MAQVNRTRFVHLLHGIAAVLIAAVMFLQSKRGHKSLGEVRRKLPAIATSPSLAAQYSPMTGTVLSAVPR